MSEIIYALVNDGLIVNTIKADHEFAELIAPQYDSVIDITEVLPSPSIGWAWNGNSFSPQPFPSWTLDANYDWQPPIPMPEEGFWTWDENSQSWIEFVE